MPYKAALGVKPDLSGMREWGEKCWIHVEKGSKLGGHVHEGCWVGVDDKSKGACVYWQDMRGLYLPRVIPYGIHGIHGITVG